MRTGTHHFQTKELAARYYARQDYRSSEVAMMIADGDIAIGAPETKPGERVVCDSEGRYWIESPERTK